MRATGKRLLSALLTLAMVIGLIPTVAMPAEAALTDVHYERKTASTEEELAALLQQDDANYRINMLSSIIVKGEVLTFTVRGNKIIDLQGCEIENWIANEVVNHDTTMFIIEEGATLTVRDSMATQSGYITVGSEDVLKDKTKFDMSSDSSRSNNPPKHDIFLVEGGTLIIDSGAYTTGNSEDFWVTWGKDSEDNGAYCGNLHYQSSGSVVTLKDGGTFIANAGRFEGRGLTNYGYSNGSPTVTRDSTVETLGGGNEVYINGGKFWGMGGANIFSIASGDTIDVRGGEYQLHHHKRLWICNDPAYSYYYNYRKGNVGLPDFWYETDNFNLHYMMNGKMNDAVITGDYIYDNWYHPTMMGNASVNGAVIEYMPANNLPARNLSFNGEKASAEAVWNINETAYVECTVEPYYLKPEAIANHTLTYQWTIARTDGSVIETVENYDNDTLDLKKEWVEKNGVIKITCEIDEAGPSGHWTYESKPLTVSYTELPLTKEQLPGGGIDFDVEYGKITNTDAYYVVVTVHPDQEEIEETLWCIDSIEYSLDYTNILGQAATAKINHGSYFIIETEAGDTEAILTMTLTDMFGNKSTFTESVWLLRLPEIQVTADSHRMSGDGSRHLITAGDTSAKLAVDDTNLDSDRFAGWFRTNEGIVGEDMEFTPTKSGNYTYRYYSKDNKLLISEPVTVDFTDYSTATNQTEDVIYFYAPEGGNQPTDSTLTIDLGTSFNQVSNPTVEWVLKSYPIGGKYGIKTDALTPASNVVTSGFAVDFSDFLDDSHGYVMPGDYVIQPVITFDTQDNTGLTAYGDTVTVTVRKYVDEIKLTANGKVIENGSTITLAPGESLEFSYAIGKYSEYDTVYPVWDVSQGEYSEEIVTVEDGTSVGASYWGATAYDSITVTAQNPGQFTVEMNVSASKEGLEDYMFDKAVSCTVNVPVTDFEVTMDEPVENAQSGSDYFKTPEGALYTAKTVWLNEQQNAAKKFIPGIISRANVHLAVAEGYVLPEKLSDINLKINGEEVSLEGVEYPSITTEDFRFVYNFGQLVFGKSVIEGQDIEFPIPAEGELIDKDTSSSINMVEFGETGGLKIHYDGVYKVNATAADDTDLNNDDAVQCTSSEVFEQGQLYRLDMNITTWSAYVMGQGYVPTVNGSEIIHNFEFGDTSYSGYYYFTPRPLVDEIMLELEAPQAMCQPTSLDLLNDGSSLVYPSSIQWFVDANENGQLDADEGTEADFNADGSFKPGVAYSMMVIMNLYDEDYDGVGDTAAFADADQITVLHDDETGNGAVPIECTVTNVIDEEGNVEQTVLGICHTFAPTNTVEYALVANPNVLIFNVVEGFTDVEPLTFTVENLGTETIPADQLKVFSEVGGFEVTQDGYTFTVKPIAAEMPDWPGNHEFSVPVYYDDEVSGERIWADVAIQFNVAEAYVDLAVEPESLYFDATEGYEAIESQSFKIKNAGNTDIYITPYNVTVRNESTEFEVEHVGDTVTVTPVQGLTEGSYEATLLVMASEYDIVLTVPVTLDVYPQPEYALEITPQEKELKTYVGYGEDTCAEFVIKSTGKNQLKAEDLKVEIHENASQENYVFNRYELTNTEDGNMLLKVYPKTGCQPALGEAQYIWTSSVYLYAERTVVEGEETWEEYLAGTGASIQFIVEWPSYSISTRPTELRFSANKGYTDVSEMIHVFSGGTGEITEIKASVYEATGGLSENFTATVDGMTVTLVPKAGLEAGTYTANVEIRDVDNRASTTVPVTFTVTDYQIAVSPESFSFTGLEGDDFYFTSDFTVTATNGGEPVQAIAELESFNGKVWETGFALSAPEPYEGSEIVAGTYTGYLVVSIPDTDISKKVPITVTLREADYKLTVDPASLSFSLMEGYTAADESKTFTVTSTGADAVTDIVVEQSAGTAEPAVTIAVTDGENGSKIVTVTPKAGLTEGTYNAEITVSSERGKVETITVPVTVSVDKYTYSMEADVESLAFKLNEGYTSAEGKNVTVTSTGTGVITELEQVYFKNELGDLDTGWFNVTTDGMTVTVTPAAGLKSGSYTGYLMIGAKGEMLGIPVTLDVEDINYIIEITDDQLAFEAMEGYTVAESKTITVRSSGTGLVEELEVELAGEMPTAFMTPVINGMQITVQPEKGLNAGTYRASLIVRGKDCDSNEIVVPLTFTVKAEQYKVSPESLEFQNFEGYGVIKKHISLIGPSAEAVTTTMSGGEDSNFVAVWDSMDPMNIILSPKTGLASGTYAEELVVQVAGETHTVSVKFIVASDEKEPVEMEGDEAPSLGEDSVLNEENLELVAQRVPWSMTENQDPETASPYEQFVIQNVEGHNVRSVFNVFLRTSDGEHYELSEGEQATVRLQIGAENARQVDLGMQFLVHITDDGPVYYGNGAYMDADGVWHEPNNPDDPDAPRPITAEKLLGVGGYTGVVTFTTDSFSPFVLVSAALDLTAEETANGCKATVSATASYTCKLMVAAYDENGKMLAVRMIDSVDLSTKPVYDLKFDGTATKVKAFVLETDSFLPKEAALEFELNK